MALKATRWVNAPTTVAVVCRYHIDGVGLANLLAEYGDAYSADDILPQPWVKDGHDGKHISKAEFEQIVRKAVWAYGSDAFQSEGGFNDSGGYTEDQAATIMLWAVNEVRRLCPELASKELDELAAGYIKAAKDRRERLAQYEQDWDAHSDETEKEEQS